MAVSGAEDQNQASKVKELLARQKDKLRIMPGLHALERMEQRRINYKDVIDNLSNPVKLYFAKKEDSRRAGEEKYKCYFGISGQQVHVYVIVINPEKKLIKIVTVYKDRPRLQRKLHYGKS